MTLTPRSKRELWQLLVTVDTVSRLVGHFFSEQNIRNKSSHESLEFCYDCQRTKCFGHLNDVLSKLNGRVSFQKLASM